MPWRWFRTRSFYAQREIPNGALKSELIRHVAGGLPC